MKRKIVKCPYCGAAAVLRDAAYVHGDRAVAQHLYVCAKYPACNSYVGVHEGTMLPKGTLANGDLRNKRIQAHRIFDRIWKSGIMKKKDAYRWMQYKFGMNSGQAHIGMFSEYMCDELMEICRQALKNNKIAC